MRTLHSLLAAALAAVFLTASPALTQELTRTVGFSASVQGGQFDILMPIWTSRAFSIAPALGFTMVQDGGNDLRVGLVARHFFYREHLAPYIGGRAGVLFAMPDQGSGATDILAGLAGGGEYFLDDQFSLGVEAQLNLVHSDDRSTRFGAPGKWIMNTASAVFATVYF